MYDMNQNVNQQADERISSKKDYLRVTNSRNAEIEQILDDLTERWNYLTGLRMTRAQLVELCGFLRYIDQTVIIDIMRKTGNAQRPSWSYFRAIALRCQAENVKTWDDWMNREHERYISYSFRNMRDKAEIIAEVAELLKDVKPLKSWQGEIAQMKPGAEKSRALLLAEWSQSAEKRNGMTWAEYYEKETGKELSEAAI